MSVINLTPHTVTLIDGDLHHRIPQGGRPARCVHDTLAEVIPITGAVVPVEVHTATRVKNLPAPEPGVHYIVSRQVAQALRGQRDDLLVPDDFIYNDQRHVAGCRRLVKLA